MWPRVRSQTGAAGLACALACAAACGGDDAPTDAGASDASARSGPVIPWLADGEPAVARPILTPCPAGWRQFTEDGIDLCDPYPEAGAATCTGADAHFPGEPACALVGAACPAGEFADGLPDDGTVTFVREGATGGDGSRGAPLGALAEVVWSSIAAGDTVALARGSYEGTLSLRAGARVVGACAAETFLTGSTAPVEAIVTVTSAGEPASIRDVTFGPASQSAVTVRGRERAIELDGVIVDHVFDVGLHAAEGGSIVARGIIIRDTEPTPAGQHGVAAAADSGGSMSLTRAVIERHFDAALVSAGPGSTLSVVGAAIRDVTGTRGVGAYGRGVSVELGGHATVERSLIERVRQLGLYVYGAGSTGSLLASVVLDMGAPGQENGSGCQAEAGGMLEVRQARFDRNNASCVAVVDGSTGQIADVVARDQVRQVSGGGNLGVEFASATVERIALLRGGYLGVLVVGAGASLAISDLVVSDTEAFDDGLFGRGVSVQEEATVELARAIIERNRDIGIAVSGGGVLTAADVLVSDVRGLARDGTFGRGINVQTGARATLDRIVVRRVRELGIGAMDGQVTATNIVVEDTLPSDCGTTTCPELTYGYGMLALGNGLRASGFAVRRSAICGVMVQNGVMSGELDLERGEVTETPIGACLQVDGYDVSRVSREVAYVDNELNLESTTLPVPPFAAGGE